MEDVNNITISISSTSDGQKEYKIVASNETQKQTHEPMLPSICNSFSQGRGQWQRLSVSTRQRTTSIISNSKTIRECPGPRRAFAIPPASPTLLHKSSSLSLRCYNRVAFRSRTKLARTFSSVTTSRAPAASTRFFSADAAKAATAAPERNNGGDGETSNSYFGVLFQRLAMSLGIVYVVTEYGIEWTVCEGPSMMPTIKPRGEIVIIDRLTPQLWGLAGGDMISKREAFARASQENHVQDARRRKKKEREWLLRLYQEEEERLSKGHESRANGETSTSLTGSDGAESLELETNATSGNNRNTKEILRELREDLERRSNDDDLEETWYETRIPVDNLPPDGAWERFRTQITTGISVGDVVVLQHPDRIGTVCKRVMGLPGDIVTKPSSKLGANRIEDLLYVGRGKTSTQSSQGRSPVFVESEQERLRLKQRTKRRLLSSGVQVPDGHIWVEGDNPWNSNDSRNYGAVPASLIMGRVLLRLWPLRGRALMERGARPVRSDESSLAFSGSIVVPVGWDDQRIIREHVTVSTSVDDSAKITSATPKERPAKQQEQ